jgi:hypothetical protein
MTITQTYYLAHKARSNLGREAARADHNLRLLVGHANLLDNLMLELADAEREQERWFNQSVRGASPKAQDRHVQFAADKIVEEDESSDDEVYDESSSDEEDFEEEEEDIVMVPAIKAPTAPTFTAKEIRGDDMEEDDLEEDYAQLELVRTSSHSNTSPPPELVDESDSSDDEAGMPPSPPNAMLPIPAGKGEESLFEQDQHYLPGRTPLGSVPAVSVY